MPTTLNNPDTKKEEKEAALAAQKAAQVDALKAAFESADPAEVAQRIVESYENNALHFQDMMNQTILESKRATEEEWDKATLTSRGVRTLTSDELKYYNEVIEVQSFDGVSALVPPTIYDRIFEDLTIEHPLLSRINFQRVGASTMWVARKDGSTTAYWGDVCDEIKEMVDHGFKTVDQGMFKLSGFLVVCKAMFELGPEWLDRYVRAFLTEIMAAELENVVVSGTGNKRPVGMLRNPEGDPVSGEYPLQTVVVLPDFSPQTVGEKILAPTTAVRGEMGKRPYTGVTLIVNPFDYACKFFALGAKQADDGSWTHNNFSVPGLDFIQSSAVPLNRMIAGKPKDYFMGVGSEAKLESTDVLRLIEDQRLYLVRQLVNGRPLDADSFTVFDIENTKFVPDPAVPTP